MMWSVKILWVFLLGLPGVSGQTAPYDQCIDQAFIRFHQDLASKFPQYDNFTVALPSSRHLFQVLLTQNFTTDTLKDYCHGYESARKEYDQCSDSNYKRAALSGFGLADYICLKRLNDFANGIPCLEKADKGASDTCRGRCSSYERASYSYLHPTDTQTDADMTTFMAGDCLYLKCWSDCRYPYLEGQCGNLTAMLELESLIASYSSLYDLYAPSSPTPTPASGHPIPNFPTECRPFVAQVPTGALHDVLPGTTDSSGSTRPLLQATTTKGASKPGAMDKSVCALVLSMVTFLVMK